MQLERLLHTQGFGSRKECRALIRAGYVSVAGVPCDDPFADFDPGSSDGQPGLEFEVGGERWQYRAHAYLVLHKPAGHECSHKPTFHPSIFRLLPQPLLNRDVQCVGRLDQDTTGLLLLSDDGQFIHQWSSGKKRTPKVYEVTLKHAVEQEFAERMVAGVELHDEPEPIAAAACDLTSPTTLRLTICEGKYHQVKRMVAAAGNRVEVLHRSRVGGLDLPPELAPGQWRWLEAEDLARLADFVSPEAL
jgi:16S rRNA pseudouridine516 synthase